MSDNSDLHVLQLYKNGIHLVISPLKCNNLSSGNRLVGTAHLRGAGGVKGLGKGLAATTRAAGSHAASIFAKASYIVSLTFSD